MVSLFWRLCTTFGPGLGLFGESYILFSIGTLQPLWSILFDSVKDSLANGAVTGVILGMILIGILANTLGRRGGSILTAFIMSTSSIVLILLASFDLEDNVRFNAMQWILFLFGIGVGGEYPLSATSASEQNVEVNKDYQNMEDGSVLTRGQRVQLVFSMQGAGIFASSLVLTMLLLLFGQTKGDIHQESDLYNPKRLFAIWRTLYVFGAAVLGYLLYYRFRYLTESELWEEDRVKALAAVTSRQEKTMVDQSFSGISSTVSSMSEPSVALKIESHTELPDEDDDGPYRNVYMLFLRNYGVRLLGCSLSWLLWDVAFYGNKLFQAQFLLAICGESVTLLELSWAATLNAGVALLGYYVAALLLDRIGRRNLQMYGLLLTGVMLLLCGWLFEKLSSTWVCLLYLASSFLGQVGPNATTFLLPAEVLPTQMRTSSHGLAAASGKIGALLATLFFPGMSAIDLFVVTGYASVAGAVVTFWMIPNVAGLTLEETDLRWHAILAGRKAEYKGPANRVEFLSLYERHQRTRRHTSMQYEWHG